MDWVNKLSEDAQFNFTSYAECFISENLLRNLIKEQEITLSKEAQKEIEKYHRMEKQNAGKGNISIQIRQSDSDLTYLSMDGLSNLIDKVDPHKEAGLSRDAREYKPIRDAMAHTALLTKDAKRRLTTTYANIRSRVRHLLSDS